MELRHLRYFLAIADTLSFTRAAAALHLTQPTLSHQIKQLERDVGAPLFDRVGRSVRLTAPGRVFREHAERALQELKSASAALEELQGLMHGALKIGVFQSFNSSLLPPILGELCRALSCSAGDVRQLPTREMEALLLKGELDLGIAYMQPDSARILAEKLFDERMMLVVSEDHPYADRREIHLKQLADQPLALLERGIPVEAVAARLVRGGWLRAAGEHRDQFDGRDTRDGALQPARDDTDRAHGGRCPGVTLHSAEARIAPHGGDIVAARGLPVGRGARRGRDDQERV